MLCLLRSQAAKRGLAAVWFACTTAGLLATSPPYEEWDAAATIEFERTGPAARLSDAEPARMFRVTVPVPHREEEAWVAPSNATVYFEFFLDHTPDIPAQQDAAPWVTVELLDVFEQRFSESDPFLSSWSSSAPLTFAGDCRTGEDCRLEFLVSVRRETTGNPDSSTLVDWRLVFDIASRREDDDPAAWAVEVEPL